MICVTIFHGCLHVTSSKSVFCDTLNNICRSADWMMQSHAIYLSAGWMPKTYTCHMFSHNLEKNKYMYILTECISNTTY